MRTALFGAALAALIVVLPGAVRAAPYQNDDDGLYSDDFSDNTGIASGAANAVFQSLGGWVELGFDSGHLILAPATPEDKPPDWPRILLA